MTKRCLSSAMVILLMTAWAHFAQAADPPALGKWWRAPRVAQELAITPAESRRLDQLNLDMRKERIQKRSEIQQARLILDDLLDQEPLNQSAIDSQLQRLTKAQSDMAMVQSRFLLEVRKLLGRDRWQQLRQLFQNFRQRRPRQPRQPRQPGQSGQPRY
jgi:hypothetical protein